MQSPKSQISRVPFVLLMELANSPPEKCRQIGARWLRRRTLSSSITLRKLANLRENYEYCRFASRRLLFLNIHGGETGIRTQVRVSPKHAFQACAFSHSAISPLVRLDCLSLTFSVSDSSRVVAEYFLSAQGVFQTQLISASMFTVNIAPCEPTYRAAHQNI